MSEPVVEGEQSQAPTAAPKIVVHHLQNSRSQRILWLLEELELPYEIKKYNRTEAHLAPDEMKKVYPLGIAPFITDGDVVLGESGAIIEYIIGKYGGGRLQPTEEGKVDNLFYTHYAEGTVMPLLVNKIIFGMLPKQVPFFIRPVASMISGAASSRFLDPRINLHAEYIEKHLEKSQTGWFANGPQPTSADFQMIFALEAMKQRAPGVSPKIIEYVDRVHNRPAFQRSLEKGGKYDLA